MTRVERAHLDDTDPYLYEVVKRPPTGTLVGVLEGRNFSQTRLLLSQLKLIPRCSGPPSQDSGPGSVHH